MQDDQQPDIQAPGQITSDQQTVPQANPIVMAAPTYQKSKKGFILILILALVIAGGAAAYILVNKKSTPVTSNMKNTPTQSDASAATLPYKDGSLTILDWSVKGVWPSTYSDVTVNKVNNDRIWLGSNTLLAVIHKIGCKECDPTSSEKNSNGLFPFFYIVKEDYPKDVSGQNLPEDSVKSGIKSGLTGYDGVSYYHLEVPDAGAFPSDLDAKQRAAIDAANDFSKAGQAFIKSITSK